MGAKRLKRRQTIGMPARETIPVLDWDEFTFVCYAASAAFQGHLCSDSVKIHDPNWKRMVDAILDHCDGDRQRAKAMIARYAALQPMLKLKELAPFRREVHDDGSAEYHSAVFAAGASVPLRLGQGFHPVEFIISVYKIAARMEGIPDPTVEEGELNGLLQSGTPLRV